MFRVNNNDALVSRTGTDGYQPKFIVNDGNNFVKVQCQLNRVLRDDWKVEYIASKLCLHFKIKAVIQKPCRVVISYGNKEREYYGVVSDNFERNQLHFVSCERLFNKNNDTMSTSYYRHCNVMNKIYNLVERLSKYSQLFYAQVLEYIFDMVFIDLLVLNSDRHSHNFGVFWNNRCYERALLFDFGIGLFENSNDFDTLNTLEECLRYSYLEPFGEDPFDVARQLLNDKNFQKYLECKRKNGKIKLDKKLFPNDVSYIYFKKIKELLSV